MALGGGDGNDDGDGDGVAPQPADVNTTNESPTTQEIHFQDIHASSAKHCRFSPPRHDIPYQDRSWSHIEVKEADPRSLQNPSGGDYTYSKGFVQPAPALRPDEEDMRLDGPMAFAG